jgi:hypothetical protein
MPRTLSREEFDVLLARRLSDITADELDINILTLGYIRELLTKHEIPFDASTTKAPLHEQLMHHHSSVIAARAVDQEEEETPLDPDALSNVPQCLKKVQPRSCHLHCQILNEVHVVGIEKFSSPKKFMS